MAEQASLFDMGKLNPHQFEPAPLAQEGAKTYTHGAHSTEGLEGRVNDRFRAFGTQLAYQHAMQGPESPQIRRSYGAMRNEVNRQYDFMTKPREAGGLGIQHEVVQHDPYDPDSPAGAAEMAKDVGSGRIRTLTSAGTRHAFFSPEENDRFRAVHDVFGHAATGRGFDAQGEDVAYLSHRQMFSKRAWPALTSETRGQNAYLNQGPGGFPDQGQKLVQLPAAAARVRRG